MPEATLTRMINVLGIIAKIHIIFGEETPRITAKAGIKKVIGTDLRKSTVGSVTDHIVLFRFRMKLRITPKIIETTTLINTYFAVDKSALRTPKSSSEVKKS